MADVQGSWTIFEKSHYHLKFSRKTMLLLGIWPFKTGDIREFLYELYFWFTYLYYIVFNITGVILAIQTWSDNYLTTASSMGIVIEYLSNAYKVLLLRSRSIRQIVAEMAEREEEILKGSDMEFINIYKTNAAHNKKMVLFYTVMGTTGITLYFITPLVSNVVTPLEFNNVTGVRSHHFIVFSWFPFDPNRYYWAAYLIQFFGCLYGYSYIVHCGAFYLSILWFITGQIRIMQHVLINFSSYASQFGKEHKLDHEEGQIKFLKHFVQQHYKIIDIVKRVNDIIKLFTLMNFVISSFQLSLVMYQIFKLPPLKKIAVFSYFITLSTQLFLTYNAAHTVSAESSKLADGIFKGNWNEYSPKVLKLLQLICLRAQKPLVFTIGPIAHVKVTALFQIFKALYSYICIIMRM